MPQIAYCPHYTSHAQCKSAAAHSPPPRVANQACPTDAPLRAPSGRVSLRIGCDAITAQSMLPPSATLGRSGGRSGGRCRLVWGVRVPFSPSPLAPYCRLPSWSPGADFLTRLRQGRCSSDPPCLGGSGPLGWPLQLRLYGASCMWPGALGAKNGRVRMAMWSSEVARGRQEALDSLKLTLN